MTLDQHIVLLTREDAPEGQVDDLSVRRASAAVIKESAGAGVDLSPHLSRLEAHFGRIWDDRLLTDIAEIVVRHAWTHDADGAQLGRFMALAPNGARYAFSAMRSWAKRGLDLSRFLPWLLARPDSETALSDLLGDMTAAAPSTLGTLLERLGPRTRLGCTFLSHLALWMRQPAAAALPWLAGQLETSDSAHHLQLLRTIRLVMEQEGVDGTPVAAALEPFLTHADPDHQWFATYSRTRHALREGDGADLDRLAALPDEQARMGSLAGLVVSLGEGPAPTTLDRALRFFLDSCPAIRLGVNTGLSKRAPEQTLSPTEDGVRAILPALGDTFTREEAAHYLHGLIRHDARWREDIGRWAQELGLANTDGVRELFEGDAPGVACEVCRGIPRDLDVTDRHSWPDAVGTLRPVVPKGDADGHLSRCRTCGDWYVFSQSTYTDVNMEDVSGSLRRLNAVAALEALEGARRTRWRAGLDARHARARRALSHPDTGVKAEAAWMLTAQAIAADDVDALAMILRHPAGRVRAEGVLGLYEVFKGSEPTLDLSALGALIDAERESPHGGVSRAANWLAARVDVARADGGGIAARLSSAEVTTVREALGQLSAPLREAASWAVALLPELRTLAAHADKTVGDEAMRLLFKATGWGLEPSLNLAAVEAALEDPRLAKRAAKCAYFEWATDERLTPLMDALLASLTLPGTGYWIIELCKKRVVGVTAAEASRWLEHLAEPIKGYRDNPLFNALWAVEVMVNHGADLAIMIPTLGYLSAHGLNRDRAQGLVMRAMDAGLDISAAVPGLTVLAHARHADSARDTALRILLRLALDAGDWDTVRGRLGDERRFVRNNAISYLGDHAADYDLTPLLEAIAEHLSARVNWARWGAQKALTTYVGERAERARHVFELIEGRGSEHAVELRAYCQDRLE